VRHPVYSGQFRKDVKLAQKRRNDMDKLKAVMRILIEALPLSRDYLDHPLKGDWKSSRDLHIEPDWLLIYRVEGNFVRFERTGRHADLFDE
jgi:mRNA interferase YafQ